jgi:hypothetical protein
MLVASELQVSHPSTGEAMVLSALAGEDFQSARQLLQLGATLSAERLTRERTTDQRE